MAEYHNHHHHTTTTHAHPIVVDDAHNKHYHNDIDTNNKNPGKMHAGKDKFMGGIKETLGTVMHAEGMKESGREQKREGDAEALAAGKGKKHYDPALARKGVGIQHKHLGPNPKKLTEGPCAGCKEGTCQVGHDYDAAICHSCTQGHCDAGHVKNAGMPLARADRHGDRIQTNAPCCNHAGHVGHGNPVLVGGTHGHNVAYDSAACPDCNREAGAVHLNDHNTNHHSARDQERIKKQKKKRSAEEKALRKKERAKGHGHADASHPTADFNRDLDKEAQRDNSLVHALDAEDRKDMHRLQGKLKGCPPAAHSSLTSRNIYTCADCGQRLN